MLVLFAYNYYKLNKEQNLLSDNFDNIYLNKSVIHFCNLYNIVCSVHQISFYSLQIIVYYIELFDYYDLDFIV